MTRTKNKGCSFNELLIQALKTGVAIAEKGIRAAEGEAAKRNLFKSYPYLDHAFSNVKNVMKFLRYSLKTAKTSSRRETRRHEGTKRKKGHKKVSKQKTLRHA